MSHRCTFLTFSLALLASCSAQTEPPSEAAAALPRAAATPLAQPWDDMPANLLRRMLTPPPTFIGSPELVWRDPVVTVAFEGGSPSIRALVEGAATEWIQPGSRIRLSFRDGRGRYREWSSSDRSRRANIRISFRSGEDWGGYWSAVGILAQNLRAGEPTMNFEGFLEDLVPFVGGTDPEGWRRSYYRTTVMHEFGHALGLSHEHFHPDCQTSLNMPRVIAYLRENNDWDDATARFNADAAYYQSEMSRIDVRTTLEFSPAIDRSSVMLYSLPDRVLGPDSPCRFAGPGEFATGLSAGDRSVFARYYTVG